MDLQDGDAQHEPCEGLPRIIRFSPYTWLFKICNIIMLVSKPVSAHNDTFAPCPRGSFRSLTNLRECTLCPKGYYGSTSGLNTSACTAPCPLGTYNDVLGAKTPDDCRLCPAGTYGNLLGLTTRKCTGTCPPGRYSTTAGLSSLTGCVRCPKGYYMWQCNEIERGFSGKIVPPRVNLHPGG